MYALLLILASLVAPPVTKCDDCVPCPCPSAKVKAPSKYTASAVILGKAGSGVAISHKGEKYILTAKHVVDAFRKKKTVIVEDRHGVQSSDVIVFVDGIPVKYRDAEGRHREAKCALVAESDKDDLAVLQCPQGLPALELLGDDDEPEEGEDCWYCGFGNGVPYSLVKSIVNAPSERCCDCDCGGDRCDDEDCDCGCCDGECDCNPKDWLRVNGEGWFGHSGSGLLVKRSHRGRSVMKVAGCVVALRGFADHHKQPILCETHRAVRAFLDSIEEK